jgi:hypothetical protein
VIDPVLENPCREESCQRVDLHAAHPPVQRRGRTPNSCPRCLSKIDLGRCSDPSCGWVRERLPPPPADLRLPSASAWVPCPLHDLSKVFCPACGVVPRLRLHFLMEDFQKTLRQRPRRPAR